MNGRENLTPEPSSRLRMMAAILGALGVAAAAYGAHGLEKVASAEQIRWWAIGAAIQLVTVPAILIAAVFPDRIRPLVGWLCALGIVLFSGSLYAMALGGPPILGAVTPLGGLALISGWLAVLLMPTKSSGQRARVVVAFEKE